MRLRTFPLDTFCCQRLRRLDGVASRSVALRAGLRAGGQDIPGLLTTKALVQVDGEPHVVQKVIQGGPTGPVQAQLMNIKTGRTVVQKWKRGSAIVYVAKESQCSQSAMYSYFDEGDSCFVFFGEETGEEFRVGSDVLSAASRWLSENDPVDLKLVDGKVFEFGFHRDVVEEVVDIRETGGPYGRKGASNARMRKLIVLSNGEAVLAPMYFKVGDRVVISGSGNIANCKASLDDERGLPIQ